EQLGMAVPIDMLRAQSRTWTEKVDAAAGEDEDLSDYIRSLEERVDEAAPDIGVDPEPDRGRASDGETMPLVDGDAIAAEFEKFLRGDRGERGDQDGGCPSSVTRPCSAALVTEPHPEQCVDRRRDGLAGPGVGLVAGQGRVGPGIDDGQSARCVEVVRQAGTQVGDSGGGVGSGSPVDRPPPVPGSRPRLLAQGPAAGSCRMTDGSAPCAWRSRARTRLPSDWLSLTPSRPIMAAWRWKRANRPAPAAASAWAAENSWCGDARSRPPPWMSKSMPSRLRAVAEHSMCQPGRPAPHGDGHEGAPGRWTRQSSASRGCSLPARSGSPPRSANASAISAAV